MDNVSQEDDDLEFDKHIAKLMQPVMKKLSERFGDSRWYRFGMSFHFKDSVYTFNNLSLTLQVGDGSVYPPEGYPAGGLKKIS